MFFKWHKFEKEQLKQRPGRAGENIINGPEETTLVMAKAPFKCELCERQINKERTYKKHVNTKASEANIQSF